MASRAAASCAHASRRIRLAFKPIGRDVGRGDRDACRGRRCRCAPAAAQVDPGAQRQPAQGHGGRPLHRLLRGHGTQAAHHQGQARRGRSCSRSAGGPSSRRQVHHRGYRGRPFRERAAREALRRKPAAAADHRAVEPGGVDGLPGRRARRRRDPADRLRRRPTASACRSIPGARARSTRRPRSSTASARRCRPTARCSSSRQPVVDVIVVFGLFDSKDTRRPEGRLRRRLPRLDARQPATPRAPTRRSR